MGVLVGVGTIVVVMVGEGISVGHSVGVLVNGRIVGVGVPLSKF